MKTKILRLRVEPEFKELIKKIVRKEKAKTMSDLIREAILEIPSVKEAIKNEEM
jgi:hypothetical protein